jgi:hypothetical protein
MTSTKNSYEEHDDAPDEWVDHTNASPLEELAAAIEHAIREWELAPSRHVQEVLLQSDSMVLRYIPNTICDSSWTSCWNPPLSDMKAAAVKTSDAVDDIRSSFGVNAYVLLLPRAFAESTHGFLNSSAANRLLSALHLGLCAARSHLPGFVPVHERSRLSLIGMYLVCYFGAGALHCQTFTFS